MSAVQRVFKNFLFLSSAQVVCRGLGFVGIVYLARVLGADRFGELGFIQAILAYFMFFVNLGLDHFGTREVARYRDKMHRYVDNIITIKVLASLVAYVLLAIFSWWILKEEELRILLLYYGLSLFTFVFTIEWFFQGIEKMEVISTAQVVQRLVYVGLLIGLVRFPSDILRVPIIQAFSGVLGASILLFFLARQDRIPRLRFDFQLWGKMLRQSLPMGVAFFLVAVYYYFDMVMLGFMKGKEVVGFYSAACKIVVILMTMGLLYHRAVYPLLARYFEESRQKLSTWISNSLALAVAVSVPIAAVLIWLAPLIIRTVYGESYMASSLVFRILILDVPIAFASGLLGFCLLAVNRQNRYLLNASIGAFINLLLNFLLIPIFSMVGAAIATIITEVAVLFMGYMGLKDTVRISWDQVFSMSSLWGKRAELLLLLRGRAGVPVEKT